VLQVVHKLERRSHRHEFSRGGWRLGLHPQQLRMVHRWFLGHIYVEADASSFGYRHFGRADWWPEMRGTGTCASRGAKSSRDSLGVLATATGKSIEVIRCEIVNGVGTFSDVGLERSRWYSRRSLSVAEAPAPNRIQAIRPSQPSIDPA